MPGSNVRILNARPEELPTDVWEDVVELNQQAVEGQYPPAFVNHPHVRASTGAEDVQAYTRRRMNPERQGNSYREPVMTLAYQSEQLVSVVYSALNTSGSPEEQLRKMEAASSRERWVWIGWVATRPAAQGQGIARRAIAKALDDRPMWSPVCAYVWPSPDKTPTPIDGVLRSLAIEPAEAKIDLPDDLTELEEIPTRRYISPAVIVSLDAAARSGLTHL